MRHVWDKGGTFPLLAFVSPITTRVNQREMIVSPNPLRIERCECIEMELQLQELQDQSTDISFIAQTVNTCLMILTMPPLQFFVLLNFLLEPGGRGISWSSQIHKIFRSKLPKHACRLPWSSALQHCVSCPSTHKRSVSKRESTCFATKTRVIYLEIVREFEKWRSVQRDTWAVSIFWMNAMMRTST